jgi:hypothetical protein
MERWMIGGEDEQMDEGWMDVQRDSYEGISNEIMRTAQLCHSRGRPTVDAEKLTDK